MRRHNRAAWAGAIGVSILMTACSPGKGNFRTGVAGSGSSAVAASPTAAALAKAGLGISRAMSQTGGLQDIVDYLISDVCVDANNNPIAGDPATCPNHRDLQVGEAIPYIVTDFDRSNGNATYMATASIPVQGTDGSLKIIASKNLQGNFTPDFQFSFDVQRDGYDLIDIVNSANISFIRTSDGGCYDQLWSGNGQTASIADRVGGWILFPNSSFGSGSADTTTYNIPISPNRPSHCTPGHSSGVTYWNPPATYTFETGKTLTAVKSFHFASTKLDQENNALELFYYTHEYGFTRWEAWIPQSRCFSTYGSSSPVCQPQSPDNPLAGRCSVLNVSSTGIPGLDTWGGQNWVRVDCRDETNYIALNYPQKMVDNTMAQNDGYVDIQEPTEPTYNPGAAGPFSVGNAIYESNTAGHFCWFMDPSYLTLGGITNSAAQVPSLTAVPPGFVYDGPCEPLNLTFNVNGVVYYENAAKHYCNFPDPSYLDALAGGSIGPTLDQLPPDVTNDGICGPTNTAFTIGSQNEVMDSIAPQQYCWITTPAQYQSYINAGMQPLINVDIAPPGWTYTGACP